MPRLREVRRTDIHANAEPIFGMLFGDRDPVDEPGTTRSKISKLWRMTLTLTRLLN